MKFGIIFFFMIAAAQTAMAQSCRQDPELIKAQKRCAAEIASVAADQAKIDFHGQTLIVMAPDTSGFDGGSVQPYDVQIISASTGQKLVCYSVMADEACTPYDTVKSPAHPVDCDQ